MEGMEVGCVRTCVMTQSSAEPPLLSALSCQFHCTALIDIDATYKAQAHDAWANQLAMMACIVGT